MDEPRRMEAHVKEGLLPVLVIATDLFRRDGKGRPMVLCEARRAMGGIAKGQRVWITEVMVKEPGAVVKRTSAAKRRERKALLKATAHNRLAEGGVADGTDTPVPTEPTRPGTPTVYDRPEYVRSERRNMCDGGCGTELIFFETLATATRITTCPACKAAYNG